MAAKKKKPEKKVPAKRATVGKKAPKVSSNTLTSQFKNGDKLVRSISVEEVIGHVVVVFYGEDKRMLSSAALEVSDAESVIAAMTEAVQKAKARVEPRASVKKSSTNQ